MAEFNTVRCSKLAKDLERGERMQVEHLSASVRVRCLQGPVAQVVVLRGAVGGGEAGNLVYGCALGGATVREDTRATVVDGHVARVLTVRILFIRVVAAVEGHIARSVAGSCRANV